MTTAPCPLKTITGPAFRFFQLLDTISQLDGRSNRGKQHAQALVLMGLVVALWVFLPNHTRFATKRLKDE